MLFWVLWASLAASIKNENKSVENLTWMPISRQKHISLIPALAFENLRCFGFVWQCQSTLRKKKKYWDQLIVSMDVNPHTKNIKFAPELFFEIFFWIIILKCFQQAWASWLCLFETPEFDYPCLKHLNKFITLTAILPYLKNRFYVFIHWRVAK